MTTDPPSQTHSDTSVESSRSLSRKRVLSQERWVYEALRRVHPGMADWELWDRAKYLSFFDQKSSCRRARVGLYWRNRVFGATPWHPVEDSGLRTRDPDTNKRTVIWRIKERYRRTAYDEWASTYRALAKGRIEDEV